MSSSSSESISDQIPTCFKHEVIKEVLKNQFSSQKNKISDEAVELTSELLKLLVIESSIRASKQAKLQEKTTISLENVEVILPQLMLDFP